MLLKRGYSCPVESSLIEICSMIWLNVRFDAVQTTERGNGKFHEWLLIEGPSLHFIIFSTSNTLQCIRGYSILYRLWSGVCLAGQRPPTREFVCKQLALECIIFINKSRSPEISVSMSSGSILRIWCCLYYGDEAEIVANPIFGQVK